jgi:hypothetical protein
MPLPVFTEAIDQIPASEASGIVQDYIDSDAAVLKVEKDADRTCKVTAAIRRR